MFQPYNLYYYTLFMIPPFSTTLSAPDNKKSTLFISNAIAESNMIFTDIPF